MKRRKAGGYGVTKLDSSGPRVYWSGRADERRDAASGALRAGHSAPPRPGPSFRLLFVLWSLTAIRPAGPGPALAQPAAMPSRCGQRGSSARRLSLPSSRPRSPMRVDFMTSPGIGLGRTVLFITQPRRSPARPVSITDCVWVGNAPRAAVLQLAGCLPPRRPGAQAGAKQDVLASPVLSRLASPRLP